MRLFPLQNIFIDCGFDLQGKARPLYCELHTLKDKHMLHFLVYPCGRAAGGTLTVTKG